MLLLQEFKPILIFPLPLVQPQFKSPVLIIKYTIIFSVSVSASSDTTSRALIASLILTSSLFAAKTKFIKTEDADAIKDFSSLVTNVIFVLHIPLTIYQLSLVLVFQDMLSSMDFVPSFTILPPQLLNL
jgi:hypothetical protein